MEEESRRTGIGLIGDCSWGTHFCVFYRTPEDLIEILVPYFKAGLETNEFCMWVTSRPLEVKDATEALRKAVSDLDTYIEKGQIEILDYSQWYVRDGQFDADRVLEGWIGKLEQARQRGFAGLRLTGNTFWLEEEDWRAFTDYEAKVDGVIGQYEMIALCTYSLDKCGASEIVDVVTNHQFALARQAGRWEQIESTQRKRAHDLQRLNRYLVEVQENERRALARELHDVAGQALTALLVGLGLLEREPEYPPSLLAEVRNLKQATQDVMEELHSLSVTLRPSSLDRLGLVPALAQYVEHFRCQHRLDVKMEILGFDGVRLAPETEVALYRIVQEALTNIARHASAHCVGLVVSRTGERAVVVIEDDGVGFDPVQAAKSGRLGLVGMQERVQMVGGMLTVESAPGAGTAVFAEVPCRGMVATGPA